MKIYSFLRNLLSKKLAQSRVLVWYDRRRAFAHFIQNLDLPGVNIVSAEPSALAARRRAEALFRQINHPAAAYDEKNAHLLIYLPYRRRTGDQRLHDPFEVFAVAGAVFGDSDAENLQSLALQALPELRDQIERLFVESQPTLEMLAALEQTPTYLLVEKSLGTRSAAEAAALLLGNPQSLAGIEALPGSGEETLRLLQAGLGFTVPQPTMPWPARRLLLARYLLFSELIFDLQTEVPAALAGLPRAEAKYQEAVYAALDRLRQNSAWREAYLDLAGQVEKDLQLAQHFKNTLALGRRDTFAFEEQAHLAQLAAAVQSDNLGQARAVLDERRQSIWRSQAERAHLWAVAERGVALLETAQRLAQEGSPPTTPKQLVASYTREGGWSDLDRAQRLLEQSLAEFTGQDELDSVISQCRECYRQLAGQMQEALLNGVSRQGWPPEGFLRQTQVYDRFVGPALANREKVVYVLADALRFEMGRDLAQTLAELGQVDLYAVTASLPTVTAVGMAALLPGADGVLALRAVDPNRELIPVLGDKPMKDLPARQAYWKEKLGDRLADVEISRFLSETSQARQKSLLKNADLVVLRDGRIDQLGENIPLHEARRYMSDMLGDLKAAVRQLARLGYGRVVISADHGHLLLPEILPGDVVSHPPAGDWGLSKRRARLGKQISESGRVLVFNARQLGIQGDADEIALPAGFGVYGDGSGYLHGGLSLQEAVLPVVALRAALPPAPHSSAADQYHILYGKKNFTSSAIGVKILYQSLLSAQARVRVEAYAGPDVKARLVGEAAECDARDEITHEIILKSGQETPVPVLLRHDFSGPQVEIRVLSLDAPVALARLVLKNAMLD